MPAVRGSPGGRDRRRFPGLDGPTAAGGWHQADQLDRRPDQLRARRARPPDARVRSGEAHRTGDPRAARSAWRDHGDARRRPANTRHRDARHCGSRSGAGDCRRDGRRGLRSLFGHPPRRVRERVLQAGVGPPDQQAAQSQDRSLGTLRARRRHRRTGLRAPAACGPDGSDRQRPRGWSDHRRVPDAAAGSASSHAPLAPHRTPRRRRSRSRRRTDPQRPGNHRHRNVRRLGRGRPDLPGRSLA